VDAFEMTIMRAQSHYRANLKGGVAHTIVAACAAHDVAARTARQMHVCVKCEACS